MASELFNRDAFDLLASLPDGSIDATITDPPYGTTQNDWDIAPDWGRLTSELLRVTKGAVCIFSQMPVACDVVAAARGNFRYQIVWRKDRSTGFLDANRRPLRAHEVILVFSAKGYGEYHPQFTRGTPYENLNGANHTSNYGSFATTYSVNDGRRHPTDVIDFGVVRNTSGGGHPTEKPVDLLRWLVRSYTSPGGKVLDPFSGSGSTAVACHREGRDFVGSELDPGYYARAKDRIDQEEAQLSLFTIADVGG